MNFLYYMNIFSDDFIFEVLLKVLKIIDRNIYFWMFLNFNVKVKIKGGIFGFGIILI